MSDLADVDWTSVAATDFRSSSVKEGKQAEFIVEQRYAWTLIHRIVFAIDPWAIIEGAVNDQRRGKHIRMPDRAAARPGLHATATGRNGRADRYARYMAGRELKALFRAYREGDELAFRRAAQEIVEEEEAKNHVALARDLRALERG